MSESPYPAGCSVLTLLDAEVPDGALSVDELGSRIVGLAGRLASETCRWLLLVADFDARDGCARFGLPSTARWLGHYCGLAQRTAVEHVRVARALAAFPTLAQAMGCGRLSYAQVRAISRLARDGEDRLIADLIEAARHGTAGQLETLVRGLRTVEQHEGGVARPEEHVSHGWSADSQWRLHARLDPERGAVVQCAVETIARVEGVIQAAALVRMAEIALAALTDGGDRPRGLRGEERAAVVIRPRPPTRTSRARGRTERTRRVPWNLSRAMRSVPRQRNAVRRINRVPRNAPSRTRASPVVPGCPMRW